MAKKSDEKIELDKSDRDFVFHHLISNAYEASWWGEHGMYKAWITAAHAFGRSTKALEGDTE